MPGNNAFATKVPTEEYFTAAPLPRAAATWSVIKGKRTSVLPVPAFAQVPPEPGEYLTVQGSVPSNQKHE